MVWTSGRLTWLLNWQCTLCPEVPGMMPIESIWVIGWVFVVGKHGASEQGFWSQKKATFWQPLSHREEVQDWKSFDLASWRCHQSSFVFSCVNPIQPFPTSYSNLWFCFASALVLMINWNEKKIWFDESLLNLMMWQGLQLGNLSLQECENFGCTENLQQRSISIISPIKWQMAINYGDLEKPGWRPCIRIPRQCRPTMDRHPWETGGRPRKPETWKNGGRVARKWRVDMLVWLVQGHWTNPIMARFPHWSCWPTGNWIGDHT